MDAREAVKGRCSREDYSNGSAETSCLATPDMGRFQRVAGRRASRARGPWSGCESTPSNPRPPVRPDRSLECPRKSPDGMCEVMARRLEARLPDGPVSPPTSLAHLVRAGVQPIRRSNGGRLRRRGGDFGVARAIRRAACLGGAIPTPRGGHPRLGSEARVVRRTLGV